MKRLRDIAVIPTLFTLANLVCGFFSIVVASRVDSPAVDLDILPNIPFGQLIRHPKQLDPSLVTHNLVLSSWLIFLAMLFDALDGRVARLTRQTSDFGGQLDSLCDLVTFGVAPAFLMVKMCSGFTMHYRQATWIIAAAFAAFAALRLARFNVETDEEEEHLWFSGLPVPAAAASIAGYALALYNLRMDTPHLAVKQNIDLWVQFGLPVLAVIISLLMVSRIPYPHAVSHIFRGRKSFAHVVVLVFALLPVLLFPGYIVPALASCYALIPPVLFASKGLQAYRREKRSIA
ncbi:MAG: CDP-diacylglycerol--serine O-phosphatidyltransferase [Pirellulales bacterium]|nr:CDP-diacylglycerol--serine O-phosphatidyltransferase [Pirellulales bacterium]